MKKIVIVNNGTLPLPAVKGGAVETLINLLIDENEKFGRLRFEVYSIADPDAEKRAETYKYADFVYVDNTTIAYKLKALANKYLNALYNRTAGYYHSYPLQREIVKHVKAAPEEYAAILLEGCSLNATFLKKKTGLPIIQRIHNTPKHPLDKFSIQSAKATDMYLGISKYICDVLHYEEGKYCRDIKLLYNSVDYEKFRKSFTAEQRTLLRQQLGFTSEDFVVMFSGRMREFKGIKQLLEAIKLCHNHPTIKLLMVGSYAFSSNVRSEFEQSLDELITELGEKVHFTGYVKYDEMYKYYHVADVCCFPSIWEEPFALTCLEAIVCGKPVIITRSGGMPEIVTDDCAITVGNDKMLPHNLSEAFIKLSGDKGRLERMGNATAKRAEIFAPDKQYLRFVDLVQQYC